MKKLKFTFLSLLLLFAIALNLTSCVREISAQNLTKDVLPRQITESYDLAEGSVRFSDFALSLFKNTKSDKSSIISPLSVLCALGMLSNGAQGECKSEIESVTGMSADELSLFLYTYVSSLPQGEKYKLSVANSIWVNEGFLANEEYLQINKDYYDADIYRAPFDNEVLEDINSWVSKKTDNMIPKILNQISPDSLMYLINALAFEAEWQMIYEDNQVRDGIFTTESGEEKQMEFMYATEGSYIENEDAIGFKKYYKNSKYAFVALLPKDNKTVDELVGALNGEGLQELLNNPKYNTTYTSIPKFNTEYTVELKEALKKMGVSEVFDAENAQLNGIGTVEGGNLFVGNALHKAYISVAEKGTRAGAVTIMDMCGSAGPMEQPVYIYLDRPFMYMIVDTSTGIPFFIGEMNGN
ncbi:MAG: serpin family protein [Clostridia bacterium]|nr:serpin family protein [Clostridia bacterium]